MAFRSISAITGGLLCAASWTGDVAAQSNPSEHSYIVGGTETETCNWPSAVSIKGCTGTLIHPEIVTSAGHCSITGSQTVVFGETRSGSFSVGATCVRNPDYDDRDPAGNDFAYCRLERPVTEVPIVHPMMGCESEYLQAGVPVVGVGFGQINFNDVQSGRIKRQVETEVVGLAGKEVLVGDIWHGFCAGDSGGPVYVELPEERFGENAGWRVFGITSRKGPGGGFCASSTYFNRISTAIPWIEADTGLDVTPCHDADGTWNPGPDCKDPVLDPQSGGSWPSCNPGTGSGYISSCGDPWDPGDEGDAGDEGESEATSTDGDEGTSEATSTEESSSDTSDNTETSSSETESTDAEDGEDTRDASDSNETSDSQGDVETGSETAGDDSAGDADGTSDGDPGDDTRAGDSGIEETTAAGEPASEGSDVSCSVRPNESGFSRLGWKLLF